MAALKRVLARTDPFALSARIEAQLERVWAFANRTTRQPRASVPKIPPTTRRDTLARLDV